MKWFYLGMAVVVGLGVYKFAIYDKENPQPTSPQGVAGFFVKAAAAGDEAQAASVCDPEAYPKLNGVARQLADVVPPDWIPLWQSTKPTSGEYAFTAQVTGKAKMLVIETKQAGGKQVVCEAALADI